MNTRTSRRNLIRGITAAAFSGPFIPCENVAQPVEGLSDEETVKALLAESEEPRAPTARETITDFWFQKPEGSRPAPNWPQDNISFDYQYTAASATRKEPFSLDAKVLQTLSNSNSFIWNKSQPRRIFALRGLSLVTGSDHADWSQAHQVLETRPNHIDLRCLFGIWNAETDKIAVFSGSTVPNVDLMEKYIEAHLPCNMMPTGFHQYRVGPHKGLRQPGAFRQQKAVWVHRTKKRLVYAASDDGNLWDDLNGALPYNDIHSAVLTGRRKPPFYSSAGCQVVSGGYSKNHVPFGAWARFREAAGLSNPPHLIGGSGRTTDDGRAFEYMLLTGKEAALAASGTVAVLRALRYGSTGRTVLDLQRALLSKGVGLRAADANSDFGARTLGAVIRYQRASSVAQTGIVTPELATGMGVSLGA